MNENHNQQERTKMWQIMRNKESVGEQTSLHLHHTDSSCPNCGILEPLLYILHFLQPRRSSEVSFIQRVARYLLFMQTTQKENQDHRGIWWGGSSRDGNIPPSNKFEHKLGLGTDCCISLKYISLNYSTRCLREVSAFAKKFQVSWTQMCNANSWNFKFRNWIFNLDSFHLRQLIIIYWNLLETMKNVKNKE